MGGSPTRKGPTLLVKGQASNQFVAHPLNVNGKVVQTRAKWKIKRMSKARGRSFLLVSCLFSNKCLGEVHISNLTKCTSPNRLKFTDLRLGLGLELELGLRLSCPTNSFKKATYL